MPGVSDLDNFLNTSINYWLSAPSHFNSSVSTATVLHYGESGMITAYGKGNNTNGVATTAVPTYLLPAISLNSGALVLQGTGLYNDPYVIDITN